MHTALCDELGIEFPIFAFTHCRDVVAAVSKAGGFGVLGAVGLHARAARGRAASGSTSTSATSPTASTSSSPASTRAWTTMDPEHLAEELREMVPQEHVEFADKILADHGVPELPPRRDERMRLLGWTAATATPQIEVALAHPKVRLIANALGTPPAGRHRPHPRGRPQGGRAVRLAVPGAEAQGGGRRHRHRPGRRGRRPHRRGRLDRAVAAGGQGHRAHARCWPPAASAPAQQIAAALALGAPGRVGRLAVAHRRGGRPPARPEAAAARRRLARHRARPGRSPASPAACCKSDWTEAWERPDTPDPLPMPMQYMVSGDCVARGHRYADKAQAGAVQPGAARSSASSTPCEKTAHVIQRLVEEYLEAVDGLNVLMDA